VVCVAERGDNYGGFRVSSPMNIAHEELGGVQFGEVAVDTETGVVASNGLPQCMIADVR
jgi:hypothetical protein